MKTKPAIAPISLEELEKMILSIRKFLIATKCIRRALAAGILNNREARIVLDVARENISKKIEPTKL